MSINVLKLFVIFSNDCIDRLKLEEHSVEHIPPSSYGINTKEKRRSYENLKTY